MNGNDVYVKVYTGTQWVTIGKETDATFSLTNSLYDFSGKEDGEKPESEYGGQSETISLNALYVIGETGQSLIETAARAQEEVQVVRQLGSGLGYLCRAKISTLSVVSAHNDAVKFSVELQRQGAWSAYNG